MIKWIFTILFFFNLGFSFAQTDVGLLAYVSFDDCTADESRGDPSIVSVIVGQPTCEIGISGRSLSFNGITDNSFFVGPINGNFDTTDFSIGLYFLPLGDTVTQTIIKKSSGDCSNQNYFAIRYKPNPRQLDVEFVEDANKNASIFNYPLSTDSCWQHIVLVREDTTTILYVNGQFAAEASASSRVNIQNTGVLHLGETSCSMTDSRFEGRVDELRVYDRALAEDEIEDLYIACNTVSSVDLLQENQASVFPNPTANNFQIYLPTSQAVGIQMINTAGQIVLQQNDIVNGDQIDVSFLPKGIYFYQLKDKKGEVLYTDKLAVAR